MSFTALNTSATGLSALNTALEVTANNLANVNTTGFKKSRANFSDLLYIERAQPGTENVRGDQRPIGEYIGLGVTVTGTQVSFEQGPPEDTGRPLDMFIEGEGFFQVAINDDIGDGIGYTRAGNFTLNSEGRIVLANSVGNSLIPGIDVPEDAQSITIGTDGVVSVQVSGSTNSEPIGQLELARFINPTGLEQIGDSIFIPTDASGDPVLGQPGEAGNGIIRQGYLESSNVDPVTELISLIRTQRAFELNSQAIQSTNETLQNISNLARF